jgi:hypothetical protein
MLPGNYGFPPYIQQSFEADIELANLFGNIPSFSFFSPHAAGLRANRQIICLKKNMF